MLENGLYDVPAGKAAVVVTHLEMTAPAATSGKRAPVGVTLRRVTPDVAWYRDIFDRVGRDWMWYGRRMLSDKALGDILNDPNVALFTLQKDGVDEALLDLDFRVEGECELAYFGVTPALIGSGAGRFLMDHAITESWSQPITRFHVHTCTTDSQQALPFYMRSGFTPVRQQIEIADDPRTTGALPADAAPQVPVIR